MRFFKEKIEGTLAKKKQSKNMAKICTTNVDFLNKKSKMRTASTCICAVAIILCYETDIILKYGFCFKEFVWRLITNSQQKANNLICISIIALLNMIQALR